MNTQPRFRDGTFASPHPRDTAPLLHASEVARAARIMSAYSAMLARSAKRAATRAHLESWAAVGNPAAIKHLSRLP